MGSDIISLEEKFADSWQAKYRGNYGTYTIKIKMKGKKSDTFSCSCPSDYYPCKHIALIENAIVKRMTNGENIAKEGIISVGELLKNVDHNELIEFVVRYAQNSIDFSNKILLEFVEKSSKTQLNSYSSILRKALYNVEIDDEDLYEYDGGNIEIEILDEYFERATEFIRTERFDEAISICKACIEEFAEWTEDIDSEFIDYIDSNYYEKPFKLLLDIVSKNASFSDGLFQYCMLEMQQPKYANTDLFDSFNDLISELDLQEIDAAKFINLQDDLLKKIVDKSSHHAEMILDRIITIYSSLNQPEFAWKIVLENMQIENYRLQVVEQNINDKEFDEAKRLINDFLKINLNHYNNRKWHELLLKIALQEKDIPTVRQISYSFIENHFQKDYYQTYKSTFESDAWKTELPKLINHFEMRNNFFNSSVADIYVEEKDASSLIKYLKKYLSIDGMEKYHTHISKVFPKETLDLFKTAIDNYAEKNTGRHIYDKIVSLLKMMKRIEGGNPMVTNMIETYKVNYKNRRAMIEILNKF